VETIPGAQPVTVDPTTGEIVGPVKDAPKTEAGPRPASIEQQKQLWGLWRNRHKLDEPAMRRLLAAKYGLDSTGALTESQMKVLIDYLQATETAQILRGVAEAEAAGPTSVTTPATAPASAQQDLGARLVADNNGRDEDLPEPA
jgi:hypothetical protein